MEALTTLRTKINRLSFTSNKQDSLQQDLDIISLEKKFEKIIINEVGRLKLEVKRDLRKIRHTIKASQHLIYQPFFVNTINDLCLGTVNETDKSKNMKTNRTLINFSFAITDSSVKSTEKFHKLPNKSKNTNPTEVEIQDYFIAECKALEYKSSIRNKLVIRDTHSSPFLRTQKSDFIFIPKNSRLDMLNCVAVGEVKKRDSENFSNAHIGQAITFGEKVLQLQPRRNFVFAVLTDCIAINIYKVIRMNTIDNPNLNTIFNYKYIVSQSLEHPKKELEWIEPILSFGNERINLIRAISVSRMSVLYKEKCNGESMTVKIAKKLDYFITELSVLERLESSYILKILFHNNNTLKPIFLQAQSQKYCMKNFLISGVLYLKKLHLILCFLSK
ncbi:7713_t:CDS:2 [Funneliformis caledonium]|uniref:7713_t:CDS:1 n=1 Tax=Funneliformis caledonium TaxID=1117310 RepID=A0A9N8VTU7_9GLOM|nr:7713_t:CDS:2 [Funneliformis caledonium]